MKGENRPNFRMSHFLR